MWIYKAHNVSKQAESEAPRKRKIDRIAQDNQMLRKIK